MLQRLDELIAQGEAFIEARGNPAAGAKTFPDFADAYPRWYVAGRKLIARLFDPDDEREWSAGQCNGMYALDQSADYCREEQQRQQALLVELREQFAADLASRAQPIPAPPAQPARRTPKGLVRLYDVKADAGNATPEQLLEDLRRVAKALGRNTVTSPKYVKLGRFAHSQLEKRFGTWNKALEAAGLEISKGHNISTLALFENLAAVWQTLGRPPQQTDMVRPQSAFSPTPYKIRFGAWRPALEAFAEWTRTGTIPGEIAAPPKAPRLPTAGLRWRVLQRDAHKCTVCGRSAATDPRVKLHVDHIIPWSNGGLTTFENLATLCDECNFGKADG